MSFLKSEDIRVTKSKQALQDSLLKLLDTKDINNISITNLCNNAKINRTTFCKYYTIPLDVLNETISLYFKNINEMLKNNYKSHNESDFDIYFNLL